MVLGVKIPQRNIVADEKASNGLENGKLSHKPPTPASRVKIHLREVIASKCEQSGIVGNVVRNNFIESSRSVAQQIT